MNDKELRVIQSHFRTFYQRAMPSVVALPQREFGFGWHKKIDYRHKAFSTHRDFERFVLQDVPLFMSSSTAYYRFPDKQPMTQKEFSGADLVFDLDAPRSKENHSHRDLLCEGCLLDVHEQALRILAFLKDDFGLQGVLVFSGQKGFHIHVRGEAVWDLSKEARRQMAEYVAAEGLDAEAFFTKAAAYSDSSERNVGTLRGPSGSSGGWAGKIYAVMRNAIASNNTASLKVFGVSKKHRDDVAARPAEMLAQLEVGNWSAFCSKPNVEALVSAVKVAQTDKAVTFDLHRLLRIPESLHGGTGFLAKTLPEADSFAFEDVLAFDRSKTLTVIPRDDLRFEFLGEKFDLLRARFAEVPLPLGLFLLCQEKAFAP
ncbi:DNA primase catalytic subunit PriS [Candidatus Micrarchaeota archaeon]|nr:DNA primase catalytic subunit PriS [Candidatus Micrarchaeota archaeon]